MLHRTVQMQDTYVRGKTRGKRRPATLGDDEIRISIHPPGGGVLWFRAEDVQSGRLAKYIRENISADVEVIVGEEAARIRTVLPIGSMSVSMIAMSMYGFRAIVTRGIRLKVRFRR